jgi:hypothetical protein
MVTQNWRLMFRCDMDSPVACDERHGHVDGKPETAQQIRTSCEVKAMLSDGDIGVSYWTSDGGYSTEAMSERVRAMPAFVARHDGRTVYA